MNSCERVMAASDAKKRREGGGGGDRLSALPDELLHHIMDFMSTKTAMGTRVLSRRWKHVWPSCPYLHFDESEVRVERGFPIKYNRPFMNFVDRALIFSAATSLDRVSISSRVATDKTRMKSWLYVAMRRNVRDLTLLIQEKSGLSLPPRLLGLRSLKRLSFTVFHDHTLHWPVSLPTAAAALEDLTLCGVKFVNNTARDVISSTCPRLRSWRMETCTGLPQLYVNNCPNLEVFSLDRCEGLKELVISGPSLATISINETFLRAGKGVTTIFEISAPKLRRFVWSDKPARRYKRSSDTCPSCAYVGLTSLGGRDLLISLSATKHLTIDCLSFWRCIRDGPLPDSLYRNLEGLQLLVDSSMAKVDVAAAIYRSLRCFPNLKTLDIRNVKEPKNNILNRRFFRAKWAFKVQDCGEHQLSSLGQLREVGFNDFIGSRWQTDYIKRILGAAPDLQTMTITASDSDLKHNFSQIIEELQKLPSASPRVKLLFKQPRHVLETTSSRP